MLSSAGEFFEIFRNFAKISKLRVWYEISAGYVSSKYI